MAVREITSRWKCDGTGWAGSRRNKVGGVTPAGLFLVLPGPRDQRRGGRDQGVVVALPPALAGSLPYRLRAMRTPSRKAIASDWNGASTVIRRSVSESLVRRGGSSSTISLVMPRMASAACSMRPPSPATPEASVIAAVSSAVVMRVLPSLSDNGSEKGLVPQQRHARQFRGEEACGRVRRARQQRRHLGG